MVPKSQRRSTRTIEPYTILREGLTPRRPKKIPLPAGGRAVWIVIASEPSLYSSFLSRFLPVLPKGAHPPHLTLLDAKHLQLLHEALPAARRIAVLAVSKDTRNTLQPCSPPRPRSSSFPPIDVLPRPSPRPAAAAHPHDRGGTRVQSRCRDFSLPGQRRRAADDVRMGQMAVRGCLLGYGPVAPDLWRRAADYVLRVLRGAVPATLPIEGRI